MHRVLQKFGALAVLAGLLMTGAATPALSHGDHSLGDHSHSDDGNGFVSGNTSSGTLDVRAGEWIPAGGIDIYHDSCTEASSIVVQVADDFDTPVTAGYFLTDPLNSVAIIAPSFTFGGAQGLPADTRLFSPTGRWFRYNCGNDFYFFPEGGPALTFDGMVADVIAQLDPPPPPLAVTPAHGRHLVQLPSWLAIEPGYWNEDRTARAQPPGSRFFVQASLLPTEIVWDPGDGTGLIDCANPGTIWRPRMAETMNDCVHTYEQPSINPPGNTWELTGTIEFNVGNIVTNPELNPADFGPWPPVFRSAVPQTIEVHEIQAVSAPNP